jgi:AcrR family transcriptional regulator
MTTPERILATALRLFNDAGTAAVSTNHIADALGMSPGNLYYHFRNKEAIIRALFAQQFDHNDRLYTLPTDRPPTLADLQQLVRATFATSWEYRFIYRELIALLRRDEDLSWCRSSSSSASRCSRSSSSTPTSCASPPPMCSPSSRPAAPA